MIISIILEEKQMSDQATAFWSKLKQWYGHSFLEKHGESPSREWSALLNGTDRETIVNAMAGIKSNHPKFPPTYMEVQEAIRRASRPVDDIDVQRVLCEYILREYHALRLAITYRQLGYTWDWITRLSDGLNQHGVMCKNQIVEFLGVIIPADPKDAATKPMRVMYEEINPRDIPGLMAKSRSRYSGKHTDTEVRDAMNKAWDAA